MTASAPPEALVIVASTRAAAGVYEDRSGAILVDWLREQGFSTPDPLIVADRDMADTCRRILAPDSADAPDPTAPTPRILLTTGGTGISPDDLTVEALRPLLTKELPGIMVDFFRRAQVPTAVLSGGIAGVAHRTFVMTLPGSTGGVRDGIATVEPIIHHIVALLEGDSDHGSPAPHA